MTVTRSVQSPRSVVTDALVLHINDTGLCMPGHHKSGHHHAESLHHNCCPQQLYRHACVLALCALHSLCSSMSSSCLAGGRTVQWQLCRGKSRLGTASTQYAVAMLGYQCKV